MATQLSTYIEYALMTRRYCYVPGLGAFMSFEAPGRVEARPDGATLVAPRREVAFNSSVRTDDGQLALLVMQSQSLTYMQAAAWLQQHVTALRTALAHGAQVALGSLGTLAADGEGLAFTPSRQAHTPHDFGLDSFVMPAWREVERQRYRTQAPAAAPAASAPAAAAAPAAAIRTDARAIHISLPRVWVRSAAVALLVVSSFFAAPVPLGRQDARSQYASVLGTETLPLHLNTLPSQTWDDAWEDEAYYQAELTAGEADAPAEAAEAEAPSPTAPAEPTADEATAPAALTAQDGRQTAALPDAEALYAQSANGKVYYIIVASRSTRALAEQGLTSLEQQGYGPLGLLERDGKYRIYINVFAQKAEAEAYLGELRGREPFADAWLLPVRQAAL